MSSEPVIALGWKGALSIMVISVLWGGNIVAIKIALQGIQPMMMASLTFLLGAMTILLWSRLSRIPILPSPQEVPNHLINGLIFTFQVILFYLGTHLTSASHAVIITNANVFFVALLSHFFVLEDRLTLLKSLGLVLAFTGVTYLFFDQLSLRSEASLSGNLVVLMSALLLGARIIYVKKIVVTIEPSRIVLWQMLIGVPLFFLLAFLFEGPSMNAYSVKILAAVLYQGIVVAGFTFVASTFLLKRYSPTKLAVYFVTVPIAGVLLSHWILGEALTHHILVSIILVGLGMWLVHLKEWAIVNRIGR
jgi:drug/metabolite transporter (DMT)-like permease